jgi:hypothetical protein
VRFAATTGLLGFSIAAPLHATPREAGDSEMIAVIHLHTSLCDGAASPLELARAAREAGVDALVITDHFLEKVAYAPWPVGNVMGVALSRRSVLSAGIDRYFDALNAAERQVPGVLILPGLEVSPYARWTGSLLLRTLELQGWHRHVLVIGIEDRRALSGLPVAGNRAGGRYSPWSLLFIVPAAALIWSAARVARPVYRETRLGKFLVRRRRRPIAPGLIGVTSLLALLAGFPFRVERWSPVGDEPGVAPFRLLEERVRLLGGVTSWAHPEAAAETEDLGVRIVTSPYPEMVGETDAEAFGALPEGVKSLLPPGGLWDRALVAHLEGKRATAPFALAELDEHRAARAIDLHILQTVLFVRERTHAGLVNALRSGRMYARWTPANRSPLRLLAWEAQGPGGARAVSGGSLRGGGPVFLRLAVGGGDGSIVTARLVRRGEVIWSARLVPPFEKDLTDDSAPPTDYRLDVEGTYPYRLISNPIFVRAPGERREGA